MDEASPEKRGGSGKTKGERDEVPGMVMEGCSSRKPYALSPAISEGGSEGGQADGGGRGKEDGKACGGGESIFLFLIEKTIATSIDRMTGFGIARRR